MTAFLLLVLVQISSNLYQVRAASFPSMAECQLAKAKVDIPAQEGISYSLTCITLRSTKEAPI